MTKWSVKADKSIDLRVVSEIATVPVQQSIPSCKWDAEDLRAIAKRAYPRRAAYNSFDNGEMRCVRILRAGCPATLRGGVCGYTADTAAIAARCACHAASMAVHRSKTGASNNMVILRITVK